MPAKGVTVRKIREVLRLFYDKQMSQRKIARSLSLSDGVVNKYLGLFRQKGLSWPLPAEMTDIALMSALKGEGSKKPTLPLDYTRIQQELVKPHVTLQLVYQEMGGTDLGLSYSQFCRRYRQWRGQVKLTMRQVHRAGEKAFVDYAGSTIPFLNEHGEILEAQIFIGVLGASNYTFAEATLTQQLSDWIGSHVRMFEYFGGVPNMVVPDNLKSGVKKCCRYEPDLNPAYARMIEYYDCACMPARPYSPKDKAKAETAVAVVSRWIIATLRHETFVGLGGMNRRIRELLLLLNRRPFKKLPGCRYERFVEMDQPALRPLPVNPYEYKEFKKARVNVDYHIEIAGHYYSLPYQLATTEVEVWYNSHLVECYQKGKLIVKHIRSTIKGRHTTLAEHMPEAHRAYLDWNPERFKNWGLSIGPAVEELVGLLLDSRRHVEQAYRSCMGLLNLEKKYGKERLCSACGYAINLNSQVFRHDDGELLKEGFVFLV